MNKNLSESSKFVGKIPEQVSCQVLWNKMLDCSLRKLYSSEIRVSGLQLGNAEVQSWPRLVIWAPLYTR